MHSMRAENSKTNRAIQECFGKKENEETVKGKYLHLKLV